MFQRQRMEIIPQPLPVRRVRVDSLPGFAEGMFWVQDVAATLPAHLRNDVFTLPFGIFRRGTEKGEEVWQNHF